MSSAAPTGKRATPANCLSGQLGAVDRPDAQRFGHHFHARLPNQLDAVLGSDLTPAVGPSERAAGWETGKVPETYPMAVQRV